MGKNYEIKITGTGTQFEIVDALMKMANAIRSEEIRKSIQGEDSPLIEHLDGCEWLNCSFLTEIKAL